MKLCCVAQSKKELRGLNALRAGCLTLLAVTMLSACENREQKPKVAAHDLLHAASIAR